MRDLQEINNQHQIEIVFSFTEDEWYKIMGDISYLKAQFSMNGYRKVEGHGDWSAIENEVWEIIERPMHEPKIGAIVEASHLFDGDPYSREFWVHTEKGWQSLSGGSFVKEFSKLLKPRLIREGL